MSKNETKEQRRKLSKDNWTKNKAYVDEQNNHPCSDCGCSYPFYVMDFDHRPEEVKSFRLSKMSTRGLEKIKQEISKCDLVCANCHRVRTYNRAIAQAGRAPGS